MELQRNSLAYLYITCHLNLHLSTSLCISCISGSQATYRQDLVLDPHTLDRALSPEAKATSTLYKEAQQLFYRNQQGLEDLSYCVLYNPRIDL